MALNLAQAKLEDPHGFTELELSTSSSGIFTYEEIGSNTGGAENMDGIWLILAVAALRYLM